MLHSSKGYAVDISSLKKICSIKRQYAPLWQRICDEHILFEEPGIRDIVKAAAKHLLAAAKAVASVAQTPLPTRPVATTLVTAMMAATASNDEDGSDDDAPLT